MKFLIRLGIAALLAAVSLLCQAAPVTAQYTHGSGTTWMVEFTLTNDGSVAASIPGFSAYFDENLFSNLVALNVPGSWDPIVQQPVQVDGIKGLFDIYALDPADELATGQSQSGFTVQFDYAGVGTPGALPYEFYTLADNEVVLLASGDTVVLASQTVPEPGSVLLCGLGLAALLWTASRRRSARHAAVTWGATA